MGNIGETMKSVKKRYVVLIATLIIFVTVVIIFVQFIPLGYRMTVPLRSFTEAAPNVYIHNNFTNDAKEAIEITDNAKERIVKFFGDINSDPLIIICDDEKTIAKLGGDHDTITAVIFKVYSYIVVSSEFLNVDVMAHEMTHAEVHSRVFKGKLRNQSLIPTWFDEGLALQNDYRETYNEDAWKEATDEGKNVVDLVDIDTAEKFYAGETEERRYRYIVSKHELNEWIERNSRNALLDLLDKINRGEGFYNLYFIP